MKNLMLLVGFTMGGLVGFTDPAAAAVVYAVDDNFVAAGATTTVQDYDGDLLVKNPSTTRRKAYMKFDLTGQNADPAQAATFTVTYDGSSTDGGDTHPMQVYALKTGFTPGTGILGTHWSETAITWNKAPGNSTSGSTFTADFSSVGSSFNIDNSGGNKTTAGTMFSVTLPTLSSFLQADNTVTIGIAATNNSNATPIFRYLSSETGTTTGQTGTAPRLSFEVIPEPASMALLGLGGLMFLSRRRI